MASSEELSRSEPSGTDPAPNLRSIPNIPLIDKRRDLPSTEKKRLNRITERVFQQIQNTEQIPFTPDVHEIFIAREMDQLQKKVSTRKAELADEHRLRARAMKPIFDTDPQIQNAERQLAELEKQKNAFLRNGMAEYLTGEHGPILQETIHEIIFANHREIFRLGDDAYTENALITLIYELVYDAFLWRGKKRKDGMTPIFFSHLKEAVMKHIGHDFYTMPRILSALKHDNIEDLSIHRENCSARSSALDPKWSWLYCNDLYVHHFNRKKSKRYPKSPEEYLSEIIKNTRATIMAATNPFMDNASTKAPLNRHEKDEQKLRRFYKHLLQHGYLGVLKILEQIQNAKTIIALGGERATEKLALMLRHYAMLAKILELNEAYRELVGAGIDWYHPELRTAYTEKQKQRMLRHLGLDHPDMGKTLPEGLLKKKSAEKKDGRDINDMMRQFLDDIHECVDGATVEAVQRKIRQEVEAVFEPIHARIMSMEIVPTPLENYVNIEGLIHDPNYVPDISLEDPLFEVVILVKSQDDMQKVIRKIAEKVPHDDELKELPSVNIPHYPQKGNIMYLKDPNFGGEIHIRINTVKDEALAQRGVYANHNISLSEPLHGQLQQALLTAEKYQLPIIETIEEMVLKGNIIVTTEHQQKRQKFCLPQRACVLDLAAALPGHFGAHTFLHATSAKNGRANVITPLRDKGYYHIETELNIQFDLGHLPFCVSNRPHKVLKEYFKTLPAAQRKQESLARAKQYVEKLNDLFEMTDPEIILRLSMDLGKEKPENLLHHIGEGNFDPLRVLSRYVKLPCSAIAKFTVQDEPGVLQKITTETGKYINATNITQTSTKSDGTTDLSMTFNFPSQMPPYEILKFFLRFTYLPAMKKVRVDSDKSRLFKFPPHIQYPPGAEFDSDTLA